MKSFADWAGSLRRLTDASAVGQKSQDVPRSPDEFARYIKDNGVDFFDFGCGDGVSLELAQRVLGGREGLGIDISPKKIAQAREAGWRAILFDINKIPDHKLVQFTILSHFLEHVADLAAVRRFILKACRVSTEFVLIKQPYFDADGYLLKRGLKTFWSDWRGHPNLMSTMSLYQILRDLRAAGHLARFSIHARNRIHSSADPRIHPLQSPMDQHQYDSTRHPPKPPEIVFDVPVYYETVALISMAGADHRKAFRKFHVDLTIFDEPRT